MAVKPLPKMSENLRSHVEDSLKYVENKSDVTRMRRALHKVNEIHPDDCIDEVEEGMLGIYLSDGIDVAEYNRLVGDVNYVKRVELAQKEAKKLIGEFHTCQCPNTPKP
jgi:hypothetical protein